MDADVITLMYGGDGGKNFLTTGGGGGGEYVGDVDVKHGTVNKDADGVELEHGTVKDDDGVELEHGTVKDDDGVELKQLAEMLIEL